MKNTACVMTMTLLLRFIAQALPSGTPAPVIVPGRAMEGSFSEGTPECLYRLEAISLHAYTFVDRGGLRLGMEILDEGCEVLFSVETTGDDQRRASGAVHWDCFDGGAYLVRVFPASAGTEGEYAFILEESPGWVAAVPLSSVPAMEARLDYSGDVDYFSFQRSGEEQVFEIEVTSDSTVLLFWVDTATGSAEAIVAGTEVSLVENYPGGELTDSDSYYGVTGPQTAYTVSGEVKGGGGLSTWAIVGIVGGVVSFLLGIYIYNQAEENCNSFRLFPEGCYGFGGE